jgi:hypothetical protein
MRKSLVAALADCAEAPLRGQARRFLAGLSCDELEFIAGFFGGCILEKHSGAGLVGGAIRKCLAGTALSASDLDHKLILVHEYLARTRSLPTAPVQAA